MLAGGQFGKLFAGVMQCGWKCISNWSWSVEFLGILYDLKCNEIDCNEIDCLLIDHYRQIISFWGSNSWGIEDFEGDIEVIGDKDIGGDGEGVGSAMALSSSIASILSKSSRIEKYLNVAFVIEEPGFLVIPVIIFLFIMLYYLYYIKQF